MLGHRGCRLGHHLPEIYGMQVRAIMEAACTVGRAGRAGRARDHDPAHRHRRRDEADLRADQERSPTACIAEMGVAVQVPGRHHDRGAAGGADRRQDRPVRGVLLVRDQRPHPDDVRLQPRRRRASSCPTTSRRACCPHDPFSVLDQEGVGELIKIGIERGRGRRPDLKIGICGEHGGEPSSVEFCHRVGMTYVSCSPFMIPIARLAAAQARIKEREVGGSGDDRV